MARRRGTRTRTIGLDLNKMNHALRMALLEEGNEVIGMLAERVAEEANRRAPVIKAEAQTKSTRPQPLRRGPDKQGHSSSGPLKNAVFAQESQKVPNSYLVCAPAWYAHFVEYGTEAHTIKAKKSNLLRFPGTKESAGEEVLTDTVEHTGARPRPFLRPAADMAEVFVKELIGK